MDRDTRKLLMWFLLIAGSSVLVVVSFYIYAFAPEAGLTLSRRPEDWASFGEYVGGTLGATFGMLAFGGVLFTIREQRHQSVLEEFQRQLAVLSEHVDDLLSTEPTGASSEILIAIEQLGKTRILDSLLRRVAIDMLRGENPDASVQGPKNQLHELTIIAITRQVNVIQIELQHLVWCLEKYAELDGNQFLIDLYTRRYQPTVCWIKVLGLSESETVANWFQPDRFRQAWCDANLNPESQQPIENR